MSSQLSRKGFLIIGIVIIAFSLFMIFSSNCYEIDTGTSGMKPVCENIFGNIYGTALGFWFLALLGVLFLFIWWKYDLL